MMASSRSLELTAEPNLHIALVECPMRTHTYTNANTLLCNERKRKQKREKEETGLIVDDKQSRSGLSNLPLGLCSC